MSYLYGPFNRQQYSTLDFHTYILMTLKNDSILYIFKRPPPHEFRHNGRHIGKIWANVADIKAIPRQHLIIAQLILGASATHELLLELKLLSFGLLWT